jgi:hypothetical protein
MKTEPRAEGFAKKSFLKAGDDAITLTISGGDSLKIRLDAKGPVIQFMAGLGDKKK